MTPPLLLLLTGLLFVLFFGGLSLFRREGLSARFAVEAVLITVVFAALSYFAGFQVSPIVLLIILYLLTLRVRLLIDLGNALAKQNNVKGATRIYDFALHLWPDEASRLNVEVNQGVLSLQGGRLDEAIDTFKQVLASARSGFLGAKAECGCHYNLGIAFARKGLVPQAVGEFNTVVNTWPTMEYARFARKALERRKTTEQKPAPQEDESEAAESPASNK